MVELYYEYLKKGATVLTTYTFRTGGMSLRDCKYNDEVYTSANLTRCAVNICKQAIQKYRNEADNEFDKNRKILIAGCNAPVTFCYHKTEINKYSDSEIKEAHL